MESTYDILAQRSESMQDDSGQSIERSAAIFAEERRREYEAHRLAHLPNDLYFAYQARGYQGRPPTPVTSSETERMNLALESRVNQITERVNRMRAELELRRHARARERHRHLRTRPDPNRTPPRNSEIEAFQRRQRERVGMPQGVERIRRLPMRRQPVRAARSQNTFEAMISNLNLEDDGVASSGDAEPVSQPEEMVDIVREDGGASANGSVGWV